MATQRGCGLLLGAGAAALALGVLVAAPGGGAGASAAALPAFPFAGAVYPGEYLFSLSLTAPTGGTMDWASGPQVPLLAGTAVVLDVPCGLADGVHTVTVDAGGVPITQPGTLTIQPWSAAGLTVTGAPSTAVEGGDTLNIHAVGGGVMEEAPAAVSASLGGGTLPWDGPMMGGTTYRLGYLWERLPDNAASGMAALAVCGQTIGSVPITVAPPRLTSASSQIISEQQAPYAEITVTGTDLARGGAGNAVLLDGTPVAAGDVLSWYKDGQEVEFRLPEGAGDGTYTVSVRTGGGTSNAVNTTVTGLQTSAPASVPASGATASPVAAPVLPANSTTASSDTAPVLPASSTTASSDTAHTALAIVGPAMVTVGGRGAYTLRPAETGITWASSDPAVAAINSDGVLTAAAAGAVTLSAVASDGRGAVRTVRIVASARGRAAAGRAGAEGTGVGRWPYLLALAVLLAALAVLLARRRRARRWR